MFRDVFTIQQGLPYKSFASDAMNSLIEYDWPGNVRQLKDVVESLIVLIDSDLITVDDIRANSFLEVSQVQSGHRSLSQKLREIERTLIIEALTETDWNISVAADMLEVERSNLSKKIKKHSIDVSLLSQRD